MADQRRLKHEIARLHHERFALALIDHAYPPAPDVDDLKCDAVIVDPVADRTAARNGDVRSDVAPAQTARDQVAVQHPCPPMPRRAAGAGEHEFRRKPRKLRGNLLSIGTGRDPNALTVMAEDRCVRIIRRIDEVETKTVAPKIVDGEVEVLADDLALAQAFLAGFLGFAAGLASALAALGACLASALAGFAAGLASFFATASAAALLAGSLYVRRQRGHHPG